MPNSPHYTQGNSFPNLSSPDNEIFLAKSPTSESPSLAQPMKPMSFKVQQMNKVVMPRIVI